MEGINIEVVFVFVQVSMGSDWPCGTICGTRLTTGSPPRGLSCLDPQSVCNQFGLSPKSGLTLEHVLIT